MMKRKFATVFVALLLLPLTFSLIQPVKASSNTWSVNWHGAEYNVPYDAPINVSSAIEVSNEDGGCTDIVGLTASVFEYGRFYDRDCVFFRVAVYVKSIADPGYQPQYARQVSIILKKTGSDQEETYIDMVYGQSDPGYSQGYLLEQPSGDIKGSEPKDRMKWALIPLEAAVSVAFPPAGFATMLINMGTSFASIPVKDFRNADSGDTFAYSWWRTQLHPTESPVNQYCFNSFLWKQHNDTCPSSDYGLKIQAYVEPLSSHVIAPIMTPPVYLVIHGQRTLSIWSSSNGNIDPSSGTYTYDYGESVIVTASGDAFDYWWLDNKLVFDNPITVTMDSDHTLEAYFEYTGGGGGPACPTLFVWDGTAYAEEGILDIHAGSDVTVQHRIENSLALENGVYKLQLWELDNHTSHIDQVRLYTVDYEGERHLCPLTYAYHSELGKVKHTLRFDDENRVDLEPTEMIDLKFALSTPYDETAYFIFEINGYNHKGPTMR
jgi:hypothetical protein